MGCYTRVVVPDHKILQAANTALGEHFTDANRHIYDLLCSMFHETDNTGIGQDIAHSRYSAMISHPLHAYLGHHIKNLSYDLGYKNYVGESTKQSDIVAYVNKTTWNQEVVKLITSIRWS
jgi:hypothetical protein